MLGGNGRRCQRNFLMRKDLVLAGRMILLIDKSGMDFTRHKMRVTENPLMERYVRFNAANLILAQRSAHAQNRLYPVFTPSNQLCDHRIIIDRHLGTFVNTAIVP
jgi:hypothetical protein